MKRSKIFEMPGRRGLLRATDPDELMATLAKALGLDLPLPRKVAHLLRDLIAEEGVTMIEIGMPIEGASPYVLVGVEGGSRAYKKLKRAGFVRQSQRAELVYWIGQDLLDLVDLDVLV